ncbi:LpqN/LpqT family lipoprotein [Mycolicibacterium sp. 050158]|uniref:LpqN/LpqT family lipoprotein n=1 Tax=Mycolicibacterium sp. 050158 TaxID=3090602 RepID=UPI00299E4288|nr:LpqN/LpqT family lipoprotein [Mycolicibacterium sp. 050158]MDX1889996.1 LpqN/LpqT family lipoprotein [Mycolicibacterium sp. 050158]
MRTSTLAGAAAAVTALAVVLTGCGSDTKPSASGSSSSSSTSATSTKATGTETTAPPAAGANQTIADYIKQNGIQETGIKMGDPNAPAVNLPVPDGWRALSPEEAPNYAYGAIVYTGDEFKSDPPNIVALMSKLTGNVDPQKIIDLAPGELNNLPDYKPGNEGETSTLGDYPAYVLGGTYTRDGATRFIAQKTVVIPNADGLYVLQLNVDGPDAAGEVLGAATEKIDTDTTIG